MPSSQAIPRPAEERAAFPSRRFRTIYRAAWEAAARGIPDLARISAAPRFVINLV
jgi:hypothetical protein